MYGIKKIRKIVIYLVKHKVAMVGEGRQTH